MPFPVTEKKFTQQFIPVPKLLRQKLWYALIATTLFHIIVAVQGVLRPGYDISQQSVSALSLGQTGYIQMICFIALGVAIIWTVPTWRKILARGKGEKAYPILTLLTGFSLILCGLFKQDPAPGYDPDQLQLTAPTLIGLLHLLFAAIGALSAITGLIVMAARFARTPLWQGWKVYTFLMALIMVACITVYSIWSTKPTGYAGTFERMGLMIVPIWAATFLARLQTGVAFMKSS